MDVIFSKEGQLMTALLCVVMTTMMMLIVAAHENTTLLCKQHLSVYLSIGKGYYCCGRAHIFWKTHIKILSKGCWMCVHTFVCECMSPSHLN